MIKKSSKEKDFTEVISIIKELHYKYPNQGIARHIIEATPDYKNLWGLDDKELLFALNKYKTELEMNIVDEKEVDKIIKDATNLDTILDTDDELIDDEF